MVNQYSAGTLVRISAAISAVSGGLPIDPTSIACKVMQPDGSVVDITGSIVHDGTGLYHVDFLADQVGAYSYEWLSSGDAQVTSVNNFIVNQGIF